MGLIYSAGLVASLVLLSACSSTPQQVEPQVSDTQDPWQQLNRKTHVFNTVLDEKLLVPVVNVY
ncbi:MAG: MlaA family lipoprotein, partial [Oceanospirillaceae bacterium]|nr:MlaA family lipoprotein [Oceanospirillaceae bacterium]